MTQEASDSVRIIYHPVYLTPYSTASCESPDRVQSIMTHLGTRYRVVEPEPCTDDDILLCHSEGLLIMERHAEERFLAAKIAAGGAIRCARLALEGLVPFGALRPPGHHANPDHNWGFCFFNNMGIAITRLIRDGQVKSAVILDIDLHFGDGTDVIFRGNPDVRVLNIQSPTPDEFIRETGAALDAIRGADILGISAGFDQYERDWGANLSTDDYRTIGEIAGGFARTKACGRVFAILEGGYYVPDLGRNTVALIEGLCSGRAG
jgi:acetoin utilization deacetylase AcuC-like enzyme